MYGSTRYPEGYARTIIKWTAQIKKEHVLDSGI